MALPDVTFTIQDGQLGTVPSSVANASVKIGVCAGGTPNTLYSFSDNKTLVDTLIQGQAVEAAAATLSVAGGPVYVMPVNASVAGSVGSVAQVGTGTGTVTPSLAPAQTVAVRIATGGTSGTATYQISLNGGAYGTTGTTATTAQAIPGTLSTITFPAGTYVANDIWTQQTTGGVFTVTGSGTQAPTSASSPLDNYSVVITITTGGALGTAAFTYSLDGGDNTSAIIATPGSGKYAIPGTGLVLTFAGTFVAKDTYSFSTTTAGYTNTDLTNALTALLAASASWGFVHVVGATANAAASASQAAVVDTQMTNAQTAYRFAWSLIECPSSESDATVAAAYASVATTRVAVGVGDFEHISPLSGRIMRRNAAWQVANRAALVPPGEDLAWVGRGPLSQCNSLYRDEAATPLLDAARFCTLRTYTGIPGYYITNGRLMSPAGSDFQYIQHRRVMDRACTIARAAELPFLNGSVRVNKTTGYIDERDANRFEAVVNAQLKAGVVATGDASDSTVRINRTTNLLSTSTEPVTVRVTPLGYLKTIATNIGFNNPALTPT